MEWDYRRGSSRSELLRQIIECGGCDGLERGFRGFRMEGGIRVVAEIRHRQR